jgi:hypothetical protein
VDLAEVRAELEALRLVVEELRAEVAALRRRTPLRATTDAASSAEGVQDLARAVARELRRTGVARP